MKSQAEKMAGSDGGAGLTQPSVVPPARRSHLPLMLGATAVGVLFIVGAVLAAMLLRGSQNSLEERLAKAQAALAAGNHAEATHQFEKILEGDPGNVEALEGLLEVAGGQVEEWNYGDAITSFRKVLEVDADNVKALKGIGAVYEALAEWQQAVTWYEKWVQVVPEDVDALAALGWGEYRLGHYANAEAHFKRAREVTSDHLSSLLGLGRVYLAKGDYVSSLGYAEQAQKLAPDGSDERDQAVQLLRDLAWVSLDLTRLLALSHLYAVQGNDAALQQVNQWIVEQIAHQRDVNLGEQVRFLGYELQDLSGNQVQVDLFFQALAPMDVDYIVWLHAYVREEDRAILPPERQQYGFDNWDHPMSYPISQWIEGAIYQDRTVREVAPGEYRFRFGVWSPDLGTLLATPDDPQQGAVDLGWHTVGGE